MRYKKDVLMTVVLWAIGWVSVGHAADAQQIYETAGSRVYQILIIDDESQEKAAIGSGFRVSLAESEDDQVGLLATNFHVISEAVHQVDKYSVQYLDSEGRKGRLKILDFDVIHDLALVAIDEPDANIPVPLQVAAQPTQQGEQIYSLGNPYDLGQTIVPGTYNGLLEQSFYQRLLFSGSLNPGMSGGPTLNGNAEVMGVNVATSGNQISFLVPVEYLVALLQKYAQRGGALDPDQYQQELADQLFDDQTYKFQLLLDPEWETQQLGEMLVGADLNEYFKCWGNTNDDEDINYVNTMKSCTSQDTIYIGRGLTTGAIDIQYAWLTSEELGDYRFQKVFAGNFSFMSTRTNASEDDVTNYQCLRDFVEPNELSNGDGDEVWRSVFCVRQYKAYPRLYDVLYQGSLLGLEGPNGHSGLASHFALSGVSKQNALKFARKFMELHAWAS